MLSISLLLKRKKNYKSGFERQTPVPCVRHLHIAVLCLGSVCFVRLIERAEN